MSPNQTVRQRKILLGTSDEILIRQEVEDAVNASPEERIAALVHLLDGAFELWRTRGLADDRGHC